jgi:hypothetical protein
VRQGRAQHTEMALPDAARSDQKRALDQERNPSLPSPETIARFGGDVEPA